MTCEEIAAAAGMEVEKARSALRRGCGGKDPVFRELKDGRFELTDA